MTLAELQTLTLSWLDDKYAGYFTLPQINVFLNNAQRTVQKRMIKSKQNYYVKCLQTSVVPNQADYVLPEDFKNVNRLEVIVSGQPPNETKFPITPMTLNQQDLMNATSGTPSTYTFKKNRLVVFPTPDASTSGYILRLFYTYQVTDMVNPTDVPDVQEDYHELIALLAAEDGFLKDGRASELLQKKLSAYQTQLDQDTQERSQDQPRSVVETGNGIGSEFWW